MSLVNSVRESQERSEVSQSTALEFIGRVDALEKISRDLLRACEQEHRDRESDRLDRKRVEDKIDHLTSQLEALNDYVPR